MIGNGEVTSTEFTNILGDYRHQVNPLKEILKSVFGYQDKHTLPALGLALTERAPKRAVQQYIEKGYQLRDEIENILGEDGVLLFPSFPCVAPYHNQPFFTNTLDYLYFGIINSLGFPSTQCPMGLSKEGLPTGIQIVASHKMDHLTIKLAEYFESNLVGWIPPF
jgi:fatty acid amide hydrolase 2